MCWRQSSPVNCVARNVLVGPHRRPSNLPEAAPARPGVDAGAARRGGLDKRPCGYRCLVRFGLLTNAGNVAPGGKVVRLFADDGADRIQIVFC